jgi:hypothetical protein
MRPASEAGPIGDDMKEYVIPLILRGKVIEDNLVDYGGRRGEFAFKSPDVTKYASEIPLNNPSNISDLYDISINEIIDFLSELGTRLSPETNPYMATALEISMQTSGLSRDMIDGVYAGIGKVLCEERIREIVEQTIGTKMLEGWVPTQLGDRQIAIRAFGGRFVFINAGNGPVTPAIGLINGSLLRCDMIMKSPSNDPYTAVAMAQTMIDMAPDHPITRHLTVAYWKGGNEAFEKKLYGSGKVDKIVAYGGNASMSTVRQYLGPGIDLIALDPKVSISVLGAEALESEESMEKTAALLARDFGGFNQVGCNASRIAYVVCGTDEETIEKLNMFGRKTVAALRALPPRLSTPHPAFDRELRDEIAGIRYSEDYRVMGCKDNDGGVIVSQTDDPVDFRDRLDCRTINIVPVNSIEQAIGFVTVHTQTISVYPVELKTALRDGCLLHGAQRITDLGCSLFEGVAAYPHDGMEVIRRMARWGVMETFEPEVITNGTGFVSEALQAA